jgi:hypothetical protein
VQKQVIIDITAAGSVKIDVVGCTGAECAKATEDIEIALGGQVASSKKKPDYYQAPASTAAQIHRQF